MIFNRRANKKNQENHRQDYQDDLTFTQVGTKCHNQDQGCVYKKAQIGLSFLF